MRRLFVCIPALFIQVLSCDATPDTPNESLAKACENPDFSTAAQALQRGADPNLFLPNKSEPILHAVLWKGEPQLVELLLKSGAKVNKEDSSGNTALHAAAGAYSGNGTAVLERNLRTVLAAGANIHHTNHRGWNALVPAAGADAALVRILLDAGLKMSPQAVEFAVESHRMECLELLLKAGGDLKAPLENGRTMIHAACGKIRRQSSGEKEVQAMLEKLNDAGLKTNVPDETGLTPLLAAAANGNHAAVVWLTAHGADVRALDHAGRTALLAAAEGSDEESDVFKPLIAAGCPLDAVSKAQVTVLDAVLHRRWWRTAHLLLKSGAAPSDIARTLRDLLVLWRDNPAPPSAMRGIVHYLLRRIPDAGALTAGGFPLLQELVFLDEPSLLKAVLRRGADINARDARGRTALMWATLTESKSALAVLRSAGADESLRDADGKSAAGLAALFHQPPAAPPPAPARPPKPPGELLDAVATGDAAAAEKFLINNKSSLQLQLQGLRAIHLAALSNNTTVSELLIKYGANPETKSATGLTPFDYAAAAGHAAWCRWYIERAAPAARLPQLKEAGEAAIRHNQAALAAEILRMGWKPDAGTAQGLLTVAVKANDPALVRAVIPFCGGSFPHGEKDPLSGREGQDVLLEAAQEAGPEIMELLLAVTAAQHPEDWRKNVNEALFIAIYRDNQRVFDLLLKSGLINADADNGYKKTPLSLAVNQSRRGMVAALVDKGHKPSAGEGLLRLAAEYGQIEIVRLLLKAGAPVDEEDENAVTALHAAARAGDEEIVQALLDAGATLTARTKDGLTAAEIADEAGFPDLVDDLKHRAGAK